MTKKNNYDWIQSAEPGMQELLARLGNPATAKSQLKQNRHIDKTPQPSTVFQPQARRLRQSFGQAVLSGISSLARGLRRFVTPKRVALAVSLATAVALTQQLKPLEKIKDLAPTRDAAAAPYLPSFPVAAPPPAAAETAFRGRTPIEKNFMTPNFMVEALHRASVKSDFNFLYLFHLSRIESTHTPYAGAEGTTAIGPFQFTDKTWIQTFATHGHKYGFGDYTAQIRRDSNGQLTLPTPAMQVYVMTTLRQDPELSGEMAAELARDNRQHLEENYGGKLTLNELYVAHFLGPTQAVTFLKARDHTPERIAAEMFPVAAEKNPDIFFKTDRDGKGRTGRTVKEVSRELLRKMPAFPIDEQASSKQLAAINLGAPKF